MTSARIRDMVEQPLFQRTIIGAIILNAIALGLETVPSVAAAYGPALRLIDLGFIALFCGEILLKLVAYRVAFFRSGWNVFDLTVVAISVLPFLQGVSVLRALRVLRVLRLVSVVPQFRKVTQAFFDSLAGLAAIGFILSLLFYIGAVMSTKLFGEEFPEWFGSIGTSLFSLFQIMTLESWSSAIARPVMEVYPFAWAFFVPFILLTTFAALNLLIGVIVNSMQGLHDETTDTLDAHLDTQDAERAVLRERIEDIEAALVDLKRRL